MKPGKTNNAIAQAKTPRFDEYFSRCPQTVLRVSGLVVGVPDGQMGNSEIGHMTLGFRRIVQQDLVKIDNAVAKGSFCANEVLNAGVDKAESDGFERGDYEPAPVTCPTEYDEGLEWGFAGRRRRAA